MINYKNKKIYVFDWDGTIFNSMDLKRINFKEAFLKIFPKDLALKDHLINQLYENLSGYPRKKIFDEISNELSLHASPWDFELFNQSFGVLNKLTLPNARIYDDALLLLEYLGKSGHLLVISSSVPQQELVEIVDKILPPDLRARISEVLGSGEGFAKGPEHVNWVKDRYGVKLDEIIMIGDDVADYNLANLAKVDALIISRDGCHNRFSEIHSSNLIVDFKILLDQINEI